MGKNVCITKSVIVLTIIIAISSITATYGTYELANNTDKLYINAHTSLSMYIMANTTGPTFDSRLANSDTLKQLALDYVLPDENPISSKLRSFYLLSILSNLAAMFSLYYAVKRPKLHCCVGVLVPVADFAIAVYAGIIGIIALGLLIVFEIAGAKNRCEAAIVPAITDPESVISLSNSLKQICSDFRSNASMISFGFLLTAANLFLVSIFQCLMYANDRRKEYQNPNSDGIVSLNLFSPKSTSTTRTYSIKHIMKDGNLVRVDSDNVIYEPGMEREQSSGPEMLRAQSTPQKARDKNSMQVPKMSRPLSTQEAFQQDSKQSMLPRDYESSLT